MSTVSPNLSSIKRLRPARRGQRCGQEDKQQPFIPDVTDRTGASTPKLTKDQNQKKLAEQGR